MAVQVDKIHVLEFDAGKFVTEASTIRLTPGSFPYRLATSLGNKEDFVGPTGRLEGPVIYRQELGSIELHILRD